MLDEDFSGWYHSDAAPTGTESVPTPEIRSDYSEAWWSSSEPETKRRHRGRWIGALLGVVLLMGFSARRRQRAIPVEAPPRNYQLEFIRHIGTLQYMKQKQNRSIWKKEKKEEA